jgi:putative membrane-bound dehydrogenase-like protein
MKLIDLTPGYRIELFASEPDVTDPVAFTWDAAGRMFVAEMRDYPNADVGGQIRLLEDRDGDGRADRSIVFADSIPFPNGLAPWQDGIIVTAAPDILFLRDTDGDGQCDSREVLLTGFHAANQQLRVNGLVWGLDGWLYAANGRNGGNITSPRRPGEPPLNIDRADVRFRPETGVCERVAGFAQFGNAFDLWGNRFINWNTVPLRHVVFPPDTAHRSSLRMLVDPCEVLEDPVHGNRVFPRSARPATFNREPAGYFNASCGIAVEKGGIFPPADAGSLVVCEPLFNIVHRRVLAPHGPTFIASRPKAEQDREFLASADPWFRPVFLASGPDGALYLADFYREWVEHPDFVRAELREGVRWQNGQDRGRIYRIVPAGQQPLTVTDLASLSIGDLVGHLSSNNAWRRDTAARLLRSRSVDSTRNPMTAAARTAAHPLGRSAALATCDAVGIADESLLADALQDVDENVRALAVRLAGTRLESSTALQRALAALPIDNASPRLLFDLALAASNLPTSQRCDRLASIARLPASDAWIERAIIAAAGDAAGPLVLAMTQSAEKLQALEARHQLLYDLSSLVGSRNNNESIEPVDVALQRVSPFTLAIVAGYWDGAAQAGHALPTSIGAASPTDWCKMAARRLNDTSSALVDRLFAARLLAFDPNPDSLELLLDRWADTSQPALSREAGQALRRRTSPDLPDKLLARWPAASPAMKTSILDLMLARRDRAAALLAALQNEDVLLAEIGADRRSQLTELLDDAGKAALTELLGKASPRDRGIVIADYQRELPGKGDRGRGQASFTKHCAGCHQHGKIGSKVGPELAGLYAKPRLQLLEDILDPNRQVLPDYVALVVVTEAGLATTGILVGESPAAITLKRSEAIVEVIPRPQVAELRSTGRSLMPEGLETNIPPAEMADLLAFLRDEF